MTGDPLYVIITTNMVMIKLDSLKKNLSLSYGRRARSRSIYKKIKVKEKCRSNKRNKLVI